MKKNKPDEELWPEFDGQIPKAAYEQARENFTRDNLQAAADILKPKADFDLTGRLRRAVFLYYFLKAGRKGDNAALSDLMPRGAQKKALSDVIKKTSALLSLCEKKPEFVANIVREYDDRDGASDAYAFSQRFIADLKYLEKMARTRRAKLKSDTGNKDDIARRVFCANLLMIYEDATGRPATATHDGPAHSFFSCCWDFINFEISDESTFKYLKDTIRGRDKIKESPLFK